MDNDVQWLKIKVGMFDGTSFKRIKRAKIGGEKFRDKLTAVWFELMDFAGKCNHGGQFIDQREIPFTSMDDIAAMIDRDTDELELCMQFFIREGMVSIEDNIYALSNWAEYQNEDKLSKIREQKRIAQAKWRANKALQEANVYANSSTVDSTPPSTPPSTHHLPSIIEEEGEVDKEKESSFIHSCEKEMLKNEFSTGLSTDLSTREDAKRKVLGGELGKGVVLLSQEQMDDLLDKLSIDEFDHYVSVVADMELSGKKYTRKTHYQAILDMAAKDRKVVIR